MVTMAISPRILTLLVLTSLIYVCQCDTTRVKRGTVTLFNDKWQRGQGVTENGVNGYECRNLDHFLKSTSSVNTHGQCIILFAGRDCQGYSRKVALNDEGHCPDHGDLDSCSFDNQASSLKLC